MRKKDSFILMVQSLAIVTDVRMERKYCALVLEAALEIPEGNIPKDVANAALEFVNFEYNSTGMRPEWLPEIKIMIR